MIFLYAYYIMGTSLESRWGTFRYNLYFLCAYLLTILTALIPGATVTNLYMMGSVPLAFAWLYPDSVWLLYMVFPVKAKWLALLACVGYLVAFLSGGWDIKAEVAAGLVNFLLFFHAELWQWMRTSKRKMNSSMARARAQAPHPPLHVCAACGVTDQSDRKMEFRYCPQCAGTPCYCINHINDHKHR
jgi:hypothetical protein